MLIIRLVMVHMGPQHTPYGQKTAGPAPVLQMGPEGHVTRALKLAARCRRGEEAVAWARQWRLAGF